MIGNRRRVVLLLVTGDAGHGSSGVDPVRVTRRTTGEDVSTHQGEPRSIVAEERRLPHHCGMTQGAIGGKTGWYMLRAIHSVRISLVAGHTLY